MFTIHTVANYLITDPKFS